MTPPTPLGAIARGLLAGAAGTAAMDALLVYGLATAATLRKLSA